MTAGLTRIDVRLSAKDYTDLTHLASLARLSRAAFIRLTIRHEAAKIRKACKDIAKGRRP